MVEKLKALWNPPGRIFGGRSIRTFWSTEPDRLVLFALGLLLLTAAALNGYQLATEPGMSAGFFDSCWFLIGIVEFELFIDFLAVARLVPRMPGGCTYDVCESAGRLFVDARCISAIC